MQEKNKKNRKKNENYTSAPNPCPVLTGALSGGNAVKSCDHEESFRETGAQAVSYTTGVPAMIGAMMLATGTWKGPGVFNMEEFDPAPFMQKLNEYGLPWEEVVY